MVSSLRATTRAFGAPQFSPGERFLTVGLVAEYFGVTEVTIKNWVDSGQLLAARTVGGHRRIAASSVAKLLEQQGRPVPTALVRGKPLAIMVEADAAWVRAVKRGLGARLRVEIEPDPYVALLMISRLQPEVVVVDLQLPGGDARKVIAALRADPHTRTLDILVTGPGDARSLGALATAGARGGGTISFVRRGEPEAFIEVLMHRAERATPLPRTRRRSLQ